VRGGEEPLTTTDTKVGTKNTKGERPLETRNLKLLFFFVALVVRSTVARQFSALSAVSAVRSLRSPGSVIRRP
jgi:hypothetical protein